MRGYSEANYDAWLERPYQRAAARDASWERANDEWIEARVRLDDGDEGVVVEVDVEDDFDEDGGHLVVILTVKTDDRVEECVNANTVTLLTR